MLREKNSQHGNATTFICLKTSAFSKLSDFRKNVKILTDHVKSSRTKKGFKEILIQEKKKILKERKILKMELKLILRLTISY